MINGLQLLVHLPLYNVTIPANAMLIFNELQLVVSFDYLEKIYPGYARDLGITQTPSLNSRFERLGYEERNIIANTGSIVFFLAFVISQSEETDRTNEFLRNQNEMIERVQNQSQKLVKLLLGKPLMDVTI